MRRTYFTKALATALLTCAAATANAQYDYYVAETSHGVCYKADKVVLNVGASGVDINMKLLGETSDECQIWYCRNTTGKYANAEFYVDGSVKMSIDRNKAEPGKRPWNPSTLSRPTNAAQDSTAADNSGSSNLGTSLFDKSSDIIWPYYEQRANVKDGSNYIHLVKVMGQTFMFYKYYDENTGLMRDMQDRKSVV